MAGDDTTPLLDVGSMQNVDDVVAVATPEDLVHHRSLYDLRPGGWGRDLWFYWCNEHTLLGAFYAHKDHPYTRHQRVVVLVTAAALALLLTSFSLYMDGLPRKAYSFLVAPTILNLTHWGLDMIGECAQAQSSDVSESTAEALAVASNVAMERVAPVFGLAAAAGGTVIIATAHNYTKRDVVSNWAVSQVLSWGWGFVVETGMFAWRRRMELKDAEQEGRDGAVFT